MNRYQNKLTEIGKARNSSNTASKVRGIKWTKNQQTRMRLLAAEETVPTLMSLKSIFTTMSQNKLEAMLTKIKFFRKKFAEELNMENIDGIRNSKGIGHIYLLENENYIGWIKCGMTINVSARLNTYNVNDPMKRFQILIEKKVKNRRVAEKKLITELKTYSTLQNGEWFKIEKNKAIEIFEKI